MSRRRLSTFRYRRKSSIWYRGCRRSYQLTCILVSHDFGVVAHLCNRIAIMQQGRLVELLDVEALRRSEAKEPYTQELIAASRGFTRAAG